MAHYQIGLKYDLGGETHRLIRISHCTGCGYPMKCPGLLEFDSVGLRNMCGYKNTTPLYRRLPGKVPKDLYKYSNDLKLFPLEE